jgi:hypothetical protein
MEIALGEVLFAPGSSELQASYRPVLAKMAEVVDRYQGGDVVIAANGEPGAGLRPRRWYAMRCRPRWPKARAGLTCSCAPMCATALAAGRCGCRWRAAGQRAVRHRQGHRARRVQAAAGGHRRAPETMGGGQVSLVGHTDVRGSHAYNQALGLRRANAVFEALRSQLSPAVQQRLRVRNEESAATRAAARQQEARR